MILLIDNYDSFSYNLYQLIGTLDSDIKVVRNDEITVAQIIQLQPSLIVLSPGPKTPKDAGVCIEVVQQLKGKIPIFGVCLGHQVICEAYGGTITYAREIMHGKTSCLGVASSSILFKNMSKPIIVARYHSLAAKEGTISEALVVTARTEDGTIMAVEDVSSKVFGVQFHPESFLTTQGKQMIVNVLEACKGNGLIGG